MVTFLFILLSGACAYILTYLLVPLKWLEALRVPNISETVIDRVALLFAAGYALLLIYSGVTAEGGVALIEAFKGASAQELAVLRETFLRTRTGGWQLLNYAYAILSNAVIPVVLTYAYHKGRWWRHLVLGLLVVGLTVTLSKAAIASAAFPLLALFLMERRWKSAAMAVVLLLVVIAGMYVLSSGRLGALLHQIEASASVNSQVTQPESSDVDQASVEATSPLLETHAPAVELTPDQLVQNAPQVENSSDVPQEYNIFGRNDQITLAVNRTVWIPYATAIDWLKYQRDFLGGSAIWGQSIKPIALITGRPHIPLEREVASMQWGQNLTGTASSNAIFFVDAWINFGVVGVLLYAALYAVTIKVIVASGAKPLISAAVVPVWTACFLALPPMYLSGGLALFVIVALYVIGHRGIQHAEP